MEKLLRYEHSPQPAVRLTESHWIAIESSALVLKLETVEWNVTENCYQPIWNLVSHGEAWHKGLKIPVEGHIVALESSLDRYKEKFPLGSAHAFHNIEFVGDVNGCDKILLASWSRQLEKDVTKEGNRSYTVIDRKHLNSVKNNIITGGTTSHHGSKGFYGGFGLRRSLAALLNALNFSSLAEYSIKSGASEEEEKAYREQLCQHINAAKLSLERSFKCAIGRSVVTSGFILSQVLMKCLFQINPELENQHPRMGSWWFPSAFLCIDACTERPHTEPDHTYTLLHVPPQDNGDGPIKYAESTGTFFNFYLNGKSRASGDHIRIPMNVGVSIFFNGFFLLHNQTRNGKPLINIGVYGNKNVHLFGSATLERNMMWEGEPWVQELDDEMKKDRKAQEKKRVAKEAALDLLKSKAKKRRIIFEDTDELKGLVNRRRIIIDDSESDTPPMKSKFP